ncbi:GntR family transcriptional regulator [Terrarubrum flagellatum]|uniref:GntR family transcriptional regulator n=1 Tax=Terrirubrum flagellatum TaxID=2895980 RepID=UPI00314510BE
MMSDLISSPAELRELSLVRLTTEAIFRMIGDGRLRPGQRLVENDLSAQLGVGRSPLREAFRILTERGALVSLPRRGTYVRALTAETIDDIYTARRCIEIFSLSELMARPSDATVAQLQAAISELGRAASAEDVRSVIAADLDFHARIVDASGSSRLVEAFGRLRFDMNFALLFAQGCYGDLAFAAAGHLKIVDAIRSGDSAAAQLCLSEHIEDGRRNLRRVFEHIKSND